MTDKKTQRKPTVNVYKYEEAPDNLNLPGCKIYSIRMRPKNFPPNDINYDDWNIVGYNIEKTSKFCSITATGDTLDEAKNSMLSMLEIAKNCRIDTFNGAKGSGLGKGKHNTPDLVESNDYTISPIPFYKATISVGPWKPKKGKKKKGIGNNNCGRHQIHQEMRRVIAIELIQIRLQENEESRG